MWKEYFVASNIKVIVEHLIRLGWKDYFVWSNLKLMLRLESILISFDFIVIWSALSSTLLQRKTESMEAQGRAWTNIVCRRTCEVVFVFVFIVVSLCILVCIQGVSVCVCGLTIIHSAEVEVQCRGANQECIERSCHNCNSRNFLISPGSCKMLIFYNRRYQPFLPLQCFDKVTSNWWRLSTTFKLRGFLQPPPTSRSCFPFLPSVCNFLNCKCTLCSPLLTFSIAPAAVLLEVLITFAFLKTTHNPTTAGYDLLGWN